MPLSAVISPMKQCTRASSPLRWIAIAVPTAIGSTPPTIAEESMRCSGKQSEIERPATISAISSLRHALQQALVVQRQEQNTQSFPPTSLKTSIICCSFPKYNRPARDTRQY